MTDKLIERLRAGFQPYETIALGGVKHDPRCLEAAARIEELEVELLNARAEARTAIADAYRMGKEDQRTTDDEAKAEALREAADIKLDVEVRTDNWRHAAIDTEAAYRKAILELIPADH